MELSRTLGKTSEEGASEHKLRGSDRRAKPVRLTGSWVHHRRAILPTLVADRLLGAVDRAKATRRGVGGLGGPGEKTLRRERQ
jgi:hypothetical protein